MASPSPWAGTCNGTGTINMFGLKQYDCMDSYFGGQPPLPQGLGWFVVVGLGAVFAALTVGCVWLDTKFSGIVADDEEYSTAGNSIRTGLIACNIVSKWTWAATLLQSSNVAYKFGISGPFWYAAGATIQVLLFAILAVEVKRKAPKCHTVLEIIKIRWGTTAHLVYLFFTLATNMIVTAMLILGGAAVMNALSGINIYAAAMLIPVGVVAYTAQGGLRATFLASWSHSTIIYIALCIFMFLIYGTHPDLGSASKVYDNLRRVEAKHPVAKNMGNSYLTMFSESGLIFGIINIIGNFGTVFVDQSYWQSAIAAKPQATYKGYLLGGLCWFAIPFTMATSLGLAGRALDLPITIAESDAGLVPPAVATHLMGKGGAFLIMLQVFLAVTSTGNAEQVAVASLFAYDVYKEYFNKKATGAQLVFVSRVMICVYAVLSGVFAIILLEFELSLGWVYLFMGIIIGSAVMPLAFCITWKKCSAVAAVTSSVVGLPLGVMTWLVTAATLNDGKVDKLTTGQDYPMLAGNLVSLIFSALLCIVMSYIWPQTDFEWSALDAIETSDGVGHVTLTEEEMKELDDVYSWTVKTGIGLSLILIVAWPLLTLPLRVFSKGYWIFWVIIAIAWGLLATAVCIIWPLWDARESITAICKAMVTCKIPEPQDPTQHMKVEMTMGSDDKAKATA